MMEHIPAIVHEKEVVDSNPHTSRYWVKPDASIRTTKGIFPLPVQGSDLVFHGLPNLHILPGSIDIPKAKDALGKALAYYPHASGVLKRSGDKFWIEESGRGVPLTITETAEVHNHYELQDAPPTHLIDSVSLDVEGPANPTWNETLSKFRITACRASGETYIGLCFSHVLGDGSFVYRFLSAWSQFYQDLKPSQGLATFETYTTPVPPLPLHDPSSTSFISERLPHLEKLYPLEQFGAMVGDVMSSTQRVDLLFTASQVEQLKLIANMYRPSGKGENVSGGGGGGGGGGGRIIISGQDALSAYVVTALNQSQDIPIRRMSNMLSYRETLPPSNPNDWKAPGKNSVGNPIFQTFTPKLSAAQSKSISAIAWTIRKSILDSRNYEYARTAVALTDATWNEMASKRTEHKFWQDDGRMVLNSIAKLHWSDAHFGYGTNKVRNIIYGAFAGYIRFLHALPVQLADGKTWASNDRGIWMLVRVPNEIKDRFLATICGELNSPAFPQNLIMREKELWGVSAKKEEEEEEGEVEGSVKAKL